MKRSLLSAVSLSVLMLVGCRDEKLNPIPGWEYGVHGYSAFADMAEPVQGASTRPHAANYAKNFPLKNQNAADAKVNFKIRWVTLDNKLTVNKIEAIVEMYEYYRDADGNDKAVSLGKKLVKTLTPPAANRVYTPFSITPTEVYTVFKDATVKYDKTNAVKVFANPQNPRPAGQWFNGTEDFVLTWKLYTSDGKVFDAWEPSSMCGDVTAFSEAASNCQLVWDVN